MNIDEVDMLYMQIQMVDNRRDADEFTLSYWKKLLDAEGVQHFHIASAAVDMHRVKSPGVYLEPGHVATGYRDIVRRMLAGYWERPPAIEEGDTAGYIEAIKQQKAAYLANPQSLEVAMGIIRIPEPVGSADEFVALADAKGLDIVKAIESTKMKWSDK